MSASELEILAKKGNIFEVKIYLNKLYGKKQTNQLLPSVHTPPMQEK